MSGITLDGRLFMQVRPTSYDAEAGWARFACALTQNPRQDHPHLGWLASSPGERAQGLSAAEGRLKGCIWNTCLAMRLI